MSKSYYSLGLMSGTSMDGVDASIIQSDGEKKYKVILDKYFEYPQGIFKDLTKLRVKIKSSEDLKKFSKEIKKIEKEITLFHAKAVNQILKKTKVYVDLIGFHGQTIYHDTAYYVTKEKISRQLGDGKLLSKLTKKKVVYDFRQNDLKNGGEGAPLTPIFHELLAKKIKIKPVAFVNLGGITNITGIWKNDKIAYARDIGPGMCLIDQWIRINSMKKYDVDGKIARSGKINKIFLKKAFKKIDKDKENRKNERMKTSFDTKDYELPFTKELSLKDGAATLTEFTVQMILPQLQFVNKEFKETIILCGGGRKNNYLVERIRKQVPVKIIDEFGIDGDFIESQAFAYLAIRSYLKLPISFPETTGVKKPCTGGVIIKY